MGTTKPAVVYNHTVKGFIDHVLVRRKLVTPALEQRFAALGISLSRPSDVPIGQWWAGLEVARTLVAPELPEESGWELLGGEVVRGFGDTLVGKTAFLVLKVLGPRRALRQLTQQYRGADSVTEVDSRELSASQVELSYRVVGGLPQPAYVKGILLVGMEMVGAVRPSVTWHRLDDGSHRFVVSWEGERAKES